MTPVLNDYKVTSWDRWEDPGDYPSNAGGSPLSPGPWTPEKIDGLSIFLMDDKDLVAREDENQASYFEDTFHDEVGIIEMEGELEGESPTIETYNYKWIGDFVIAVPVFECSCMSLDEAVKWTLKTWIPKERKFVLPAEQARAIAELIVTSPDKGPSQLSDQISEWDKPQEDPTKPFQVKTDAKSLGRLICAAKQGKMPNAHGETLAQQGLQTLLKAL